MERVHELNMFNFSKRCECDRNSTPFFKYECEVNSIPEKKERTMLCDRLMKLPKSRNLGFGYPIYIANKIRRAMFFKPDNKYNYVATSHTM